MWNLKSSMTDRMEYDRMARKSGKDSARVLKDSDLKIVDAKQVAFEVFEVDINAGSVCVDDVEEARARWISEFPKGYQDEKERRAKEVG